ncbi:MAG: type III pantothenate kinase [Lachnospiraceae bacterium]|jgi:type III pantothenate kinase|nr:type III pantothenate kinase [Lachnospiraceae bacterium]
MILAIDTGNTHTVLGCIGEDGTIEPVMRLQTALHRTEYEYCADMYRILKLVHVDSRKIDGAIISSVVPGLVITLKRAVKMLTGLDALVVGAGLKTGLDIVLDDPGTIAADLVATAVAAKELYPLPAFIVDMGTATKITVVDAKGRYIGGTIGPGVGISLDALVNETSLLPGIEIVPPSKVIATNTIDAMRSGVFYGAVGTVDGILDRFEKEMGPAATIVSTGGLAGRITGACSHRIIRDDNLLLKGLGILYRKNRPTKGRSPKNNAAEEKPRA